MTHNQFSPFPAIQIQTIYLAAIKRNKYIIADVVNYFIEDEKIYFDLMLVLK